MSRHHRALIVVAIVIALAAACTSATRPSAAAKHAARSSTSTSTTTSASTSTTTATTATPTSPPLPDAATVFARALLPRLAVKGRAPKTGYSRDRFGPAWADVDHNGCDTRNDILNRDLTAKAWRAGTHDCVVISGVLADPYTGRTITFVKARAYQVQIDHVVALSDAWQTGAQYLDAATRERFANDPLNLLAVDGPTNEQKGDADAASWLPPNRGFRCAYVARQVAVKANYGLWVTPAEHDAMAFVLASCSAATASAPAPAPTPQPPPPAAPAPAAPPPGGEPYYANCTAARAAGAAPILRGQPGYRPALDRDGDGVACE